MLLSCPLITKKCPLIRSPEGNEADEASDSRHPYVSMESLPESTTTGNCGSESARKAELRIHEGKV